MYSENDREETQRQIRIFWILYIAAILLIAAALVVLCVVRLAWPGFVLVPVLTFIIVAGWDLWGSRLKAYQTYLDMDKDHIPQMVEGRVMDIPKDVKTYNGVRFRQIEIRIPPENEGDDPVDSYLYYDVCKQPVPFEIGDRIHAVVMERCIRDVEIME